MKTFAILITMLVLTGCAAFQEVTPETFADSCTRLGYKPGTVAHAGCAERTMQAYWIRRAEFGRALGQAGQQISQQSQSDDKMTICNETPTGFICNEY